jgi:predicted transcriptional regulator
MQHRGEIVEHAVRQSGLSLTKLATRIGKSRKWIYDSFQNPNLSIEYVIAIGKIIYHDFSLEINELKNKSFSHQGTENTNDSSDNFWKNKYIELLEKHNQLLEKVVK